MKHTLFTRHIVGTLSLSLVCAALLSAATSSAHAATSSADGTTSSTQAATIAAHAALSSPQEHKSPSVTQDDTEKQIIELFGKVERRLREIDQLLYDAGAGDRSKLQQVGASGMDELLNHTRDSGRAVLNDIDKILELAKNLPNQQSGSSGQNGGEPQGSDTKGQSPLDKQGSTSTEREPTPSSPQPGGKENGTKPTPEPPQGSEGQPHDPRSSDDKNPKTAPGQTQPAGPTQGPNPRTDGKDRWGDLPIHARDVFRIEGGGDMPVQYRDWIDSYYRRLNKKP